MVSARLNDGEVFDSAKLKNTIRFLIENDMRNIVIDLGSLEYLYSDTINAFIASNRQMLEVSGRIAILSEHPKVQDILKRAGLDNIMRIYRSEAEMIADSKEILRQTSSYRIDELQKMGQPRPQGPLMPQEPAVPKTEFDDFRSEMGEQLGTKLENNEVPQHQYGAPTSPAAPVAPASPAFGGFPQNPEPPQQQQYPGFQTPPNYPPQQQPQYGAFPQTPAQPTGYPTANFDFPTVQIPAGGYGTPGGHSISSPPSQPSEPDDDSLEQRGRMGSQDRSRGPASRKPQGRRVGGREEVQAREPEREEMPMMAAPAHVPAEPPSPPTPPREPVGSASSLVDHRSSSKSPVLLGLFLLVLVGGGAYYFLKGKKTAPVEPAPVEQPATGPVPTEPVAPASPDSVKPVAEVPKPVAEKPVAPTPTPPAPKPVPKAETKPVAKPEPKPETKPVAVAPKPKPEPPAANKPEIKVPKGQLSVVTNPPGAEVLVNFSKKGLTPTLVALNNNANRIILKLPGYKRYETTINKNTTQKELRVDLESESGGGGSGGETAKPAPEPAGETRVENPYTETYESPKPEPKPASKPTPKAETKPVPKPEPKPEPKIEPEVSKPAFTPGNGEAGVIFLSSSPARADIVIDGKSIDKKTPTKLTLPSGSHRIEMAKDGMKASVDQDISPGKNKALHLQLQ